MALSCDPLRAKPSARPVGVPTRIVGSVGVGMNGPGSRTVVSLTSCLAGRPFAGSGRLDETSAYARSEENASALPTALATTVRTFTGVWVLALFSAVDFVA